MLTVTTRPLSADERAILERRFRPLGLAVEFVLLGLIVVLGAVAIGLALAAGVGWLLGRLRVDPGAYPQLLSVGAVGVVCAVGFAGYVRFTLRARRKIKEDLRAGEAQILHVKGPVVVQQEERDDEGPILYFGLGEDRVLFLWGQWLYDPGTYSAPDEGLPDDVPEHLNGLPDPYGFPSSEFRLTRAPRSGVVLGIEVLGDYRPPSRTIGRREVKFTDLGESEVLRGNIDSLQEAVDGHRPAPRGS